MENTQLFLKKQSLKQTSTFLISEVLYYTDEGRSNSW